MSPPDDTTAQPDASRPGAGGRGPVRGALRLSLLLALVAAAIDLVRRRIRGRALDRVLWDDAETAPPAEVPEHIAAAADRPRTGAPADRGRAATVGLDVARLASAGDLQPAVQYLTYIQSRRGDGSRLLFVRYDDLDAMAELSQQPTTDFLARLEQLGVVVSPN
jgi:hypothetical protein